MPKQRTTPTTYRCVYCDKENSWSYSTHNKFCNNQCQRDYQWEQETKPRLILGVGLADTKTIRKFLVEVRGGKCELCPVTDTWNDKPLTLHVDHIDGCSDNNSLSNLRLLCPNCHSQTDTYCGRNTTKQKQTKRNKYIRQYYKTNTNKWRNGRRDS